MWTVQSGFKRLDYPRRLHKTWQLSWRSIFLCASDFSRPRDDRRLYLSNRNWYIDIGNSGMFLCFSHLCYKLSQLSLRFGGYGSSGAPLDMPNQWLCCPSSVCWLSRVSHSRQSLCFPPIKLSPPSIRLEDYHTSNHITRCRRSTTG